MTAAQQRRFPSPLRYPGGKGKVANFIKLLFLENNLVGYHYVEPYAGGASVAFSLLYEEYASHIHINDLNRSVYAFWDAVLHHTAELCERIRVTPVDMDQWLVQRAVQEDPNSTGLDLAFSTFFLNRTNRSGIIWSGGVIGGKEQGGKWKLDARYNTEGLIRRIEKIARYGNRITLTQRDAEAFLLEDVPQLPQESFLYLDPPYFVKGGALYEHAYKAEDHEAIAAAVHRLDRPWVVSYDAAPEILPLYAGYESIEYALGYSAAECYEGGEVMFFSPGLISPEVDSPARIGSAVADQARLKLWEA